MGFVHRNAQPFFMLGDKKIICLLIHGFTGSPADVGVLGTYLHDKGYVVSSILLPGHGTTPEDMLKTAWPDWYGAVEEEYLRIKKEYEDYHIVPMGLSMGGILALHLASNYQVPGVVCFSAPIYMVDERAYEASRFDNDFIPKNNDPEDIKREMAEGRFSYNVMPTKPLVSLFELIDKVKPELGVIGAPALIIQSTDDNTVKPESATYIYEQLGSENKKLLWLKKSGHVITLGMERNQVFQAVEVFLQEIFTA
ncbi:MAG: carboxylesterase [Firmicutes bacterium HGW-Firmicutes-12]|jgi:carboxylesterase|nr:MAG: carboxylesterase [Firmicutes bacterium HGW-Firmicutes-12]